MQMLEPHQYFRDPDYGPGSQTLPRWHIAVV